MDRFFTVIARVNSVLLLLILLGGAGAMAYFAIDSGGGHRSSPALATNIVQGIPAPVRLGLGHPQPVTGTDATMLELKIDGSYSKLGSERGSGEVRNVLFIKGAANHAHWLFKGNQNLVLDAAQVRTEQNDMNAPTVAIYVSYVAADTNGDGALTDEDEAMLGIARPDGTDFVPALQAVGRVISYQMRGVDQLSVVYQRGNTLRHAAFSLARRKVDSDTEILKVAAHP